jgi:hypothetical protein
MPAPFKLFTSHECETHPTVMCFIWSGQTTATPRRDSVVTALYHKLGETRLVGWETPRMWSGFKGGER